MTLPVVLLAPWLLGRITPDTDLVTLAVPMLRLNVAGSAFGGIVMLTTCLCQVSGKAKQALVLSLSRQGVVFAAILLLLSALFGYWGILSAQCAADVLSAGIAGWILLKGKVLKTT